MIALGQGEGGKWYAGTQQLQLASFELCFACRRFRTLRVTVESAMPLSLWDDGESPGEPLKAHKTRQLPPLRAAAVSWMLPAGMFVPLLSQAALLKEAEWVQLTGVDCGGLETNPSALAFWGVVSRTVEQRTLSPRMFFQFVQCMLDEVHDTFACVPKFTDGARRAIDVMESMASVSWPSSLRQLSIGYVRNQRVDFASLPRSLERLVLGGEINQPIESVAWPVALKHLTLGGDFNQSIANIVWPASLKQLTFGESFNQPISGTDFVWPKSLLQLALGDSFNQPIVGVVWPASLLQLTLGGEFDQSIAGVVWPSSLMQLTLGNGFDQPIDDVVWPVLLVQLTFGDKFNRSISDVKWPTFLLRLAFGAKFDQPMTDVALPPPLVRLSFGRCFNQPINEVTWPDHLRSLEFGEAFDQAIEETIWPSSLRSIDFGLNAYVEADALAWPRHLRIECSYDPYEHGECFDFSTVVVSCDDPRTVSVEYLNLYTWRNSFNIDEVW